MPINSAPARLNTASGAAPSYAARAWVSFQGTGTVTIRGSGNVTSITDNGVGDFTVNLTNAMQDANYTIVGTSSGSAAYAGGYMSILDAASNPAGTFANPNAGSFRIRTGVDYGTYMDHVYTNVAVFR